MQEMFPEKHGSIIKRFPNKYKYDAARSRSY